MNLRAAKQATPREQLIQDLMDSRVPKTEREHAAVREIERLRAALAEDAMQRLTDEQQEIENDSFDKQPASGIHLGVSNGADRDVESMTDVQQEMEETHTSVDKYTPVEPVAWMWDYKRLDGHVETKVIFAKHYNHFPGDLAYVLEGKDTTPLYAAPPKRKPLTKAKIETVADSLPADDLGMPTTWHLRLARAIERAHGIGGEE